MSECPFFLFPRVFFFVFMTTLFFVWTVSVSAFWERLYKSIKTYEDERQNTTLHVQLRLKKNFERP